ncbi:MAG: hypothetical protein NZ730_12570 [Porticoccaceae bacterium]|nr:hypothetical protein [Porticoccaceae bacterium]
MKQIIIMLHMIMASMPIFAASLADQLSAVKTLQVEQEATQQALDKIERDLERRVKSAAVRKSEAEADAYIAEQRARQAAASAKATNAVENVGSQDKLQRLRDRAAMARLRTEIAKEGTAQAAEKVRTSVAADNVAREQSMRDADAAAYNNAAGKRQEAEVDRYQAGSDVLRSVDRAAEAAASRDIEVNVDNTKIIK